MPSLPTDSHDGHCFVKEHPSATSQDPNVDCNAVACVSIGFDDASVRSRHSARMTCIMVVRGFVAAITTIGIAKVVAAGACFRIFGECNSRLTSQKDKINCLFGVSKEPRSMVAVSSPLCVVFRGAVGNRFKEQNARDQETESLKSEPELAALLFTAPRNNPPKYHVRPTNKSKGIICKLHGGGAAAISTEKPIKRGKPRESALLNRMIPDPATLQEQSGSLPFIALFVHVENDTKFSRPEAKHQLEMHKELKGRDGWGEPWWAEHQGDVQKRIVKEVRDYRLKRDLRPFDFNYSEHKEIPVGLPRQTDPETFDLSR
ncbi:hypothetical protein OOU_Y34scaffold00692g40 [Pyricularia oryzae Y34]|uniref:Uncharacterized protein n=2 Tax=Pyricularia oryzae TaxID=318829 RepID=A0AA97PID9_PYRO3|nr:hypothetical protein OOU_Y34scaffold00692g40 [Pyricularia oryzae Y34]